MRLSGCWNLQVSTSSVSFFQLFINICDFLLVFMVPLCFVDQYVEDEIEISSCDFIVIWQWLNVLNYFNIKSALSSFVPYILQRVNLRPLISASIITYLPSSSCIDLHTVNGRDLWININVLFELLVPWEKNNIPSHACLQTYSDAEIVCVSCKNINLASLSSSHVKTSFRLIMFLNPLVFKVTTFMPSAISNF